MSESKTRRTSGKLPQVLAEQLRNRYGEGPHFINEPICKYQGSMRVNKGGWQVFCQLHKDGNGISKLVDAGNCPCNERVKP